MRWYWPNAILRTIKSEKSVNKERQVINKASEATKKHQDVDDDDDDDDDEELEDRFKFCEPKSRTVDLGGVYKERLDAFLSQDEEAGVENKARTSIEHTETVKLKLSVREEEEKDSDDTNSNEMAGLSGKVREDKILAEMRKSEDDGFSDRDEPSDEYLENDEEEEDDEEVSFFS